MSSLAAASGEIAAPRGVRRRRRKRVALLLLLLPGAGFIALAMIAPLLQLLLGSLGLTGLGSDQGFSLAAFEAVLANPMMRDALLFSLRIAAATTVLSVLSALALVALLTLRFPGRRLVMLLYKLPLVVPSLIAAFLVLTMIGPGGMGARLAAQFGLGWPALVHDRAGIGITLVLLWHQIPVTLLILLAVVGAIPLDLIDAARNLGATAPSVFRHVILPLALPGISAAALLVFIDCFGAYAVPSLLGPAYPQALPVMMTTEFLERAHWQVASAIGVVMTLTTIAVMVLYHRLIARADRTPAR